MDNILKNIVLTPFNLLYKVNPRIELEFLYRLKCGHKLNLDNPQTYNEKIQWIKLYDRNPLMPVCCDKYTVRKYVEEKGCGEILNTLLWEGFDPENIPFEQLPNQFVIKVTHGSTFNIICKDKSKLNKRESIKKCKKWLKAKFLEAYGEWFYGIEKPRVMVEKYLDDGTGRLRDYKIYCFNGKPGYIGVDTGNDSLRTHYKDIYDTEWNLKKGYKMLYPPSGIAIEKPSGLDKMLEYAKILSEDFLHARTDFYLINGKVVFGEITFTNSAGFGRVDPKEFSLDMGNKITLPLTKKFFE